MVTKLLCGAKPSVTDSDKCIKLIKDRNSHARTDFISKAHHPRTQTQSKMKTVGASTCQEHVRTSENGHQSKTCNLPWKVPDMGYKHYIADHEISYLARLWPSSHICWPSSMLPLLGGVGK
jgi:hypothetical protein